MSKKQTASGDPEFNDLGPLPGFAPPGDADVTPTDAGLSGRMPSIPADGGFLEENDLMHLDNVLDFEVTDPALAASAPPLGMGRRPQPRRQRQQRRRRRLRRLDRLWV